MRKPFIAIPLAYSVAAGLWILFSDQFTAALFHDTGVLTRIQTYKGLGFVFGTAVLLALLIRRGFKRLEDSRSQLEQSLAEKDALLSELHHRVKNNMQMASSLLSLQAMHMNDPTCQRAIEDNRRRLTSIGMVHEQFYQSGSFARLDFGRYARGMVEGLRASLGAESGPVSVRVDIPSLLMSLELAVPCGLLLNEAASNAFKYAFTDRRGGVLTIRMNRTDDGRYRLEVADDGPGLPPGVNERTSLGLTLMRILAEQLGGGLTVQGKGGVRILAEFTGKRK